MVQFQLFIPCIHVIIFAKWIKQKKYNKMKWRVWNDFIFMLFKYMIYSIQIVHHPISLMRTIMPIKMSVYFFSLFLLVFKYDGKFWRISLVFLWFRVFEWILFVFYSSSCYFYQTKWFASRILHVFFRGLKDVLKMIKPLIFLHLILSFKNSSSTTRSKKKMSKF